MFTLIFSCTQAELLTLAERNYKISWHGTSWPGDWPIMGQKSPTISTRSGNLKTLCLRKHKSQNLWTSGCTNAQMLPTLQSKVQVGHFLPPPPKKETWALKVCEMVLSLNGKLRQLRCKDQSMNPSLASWHHPWFKHWRPQSPMLSNGRKV